MADISSETDKLLAELGIGAEASVGSSGASVSVKTSAGPPPSAPAPPPPPPPPPPAKAPAKASISLKTKPPPAKTAGGGGGGGIDDAQKEIDDIFDSVISFAGKTSNKKKSPPPVAPKPKRKIHVSSYTMQTKKKEGQPAKGVPDVPAPPPPAPVPPKTSSLPTKPLPHPSQKIVVKEAEAKQVEIKPKAVEISLPTPEPVALVAFGPGLETFEVNCFGDFQVSCPHETDVDDLEVTVKGPSGSKPVDIQEHGNGQFACSYHPTIAGDHVVTIKVDGKHIPGSPFTAQVKFAAYTDKCTVEGPGLVSGSTDAPCHFKIRAKEDAGYARLRVHIIGPSKAEPIQMVENEVEKCVDVVYNPSASGDYEIRVLWGDAHVHGSPFTVPVTGPTFNDPSKVKVTGEGLKGGNVGDELKIFVEGEAGAGPGPLGVRMVGPSKPEIKADDSSEEGVELTVVCRDPGEYQLILKWGHEEHPQSPWTMKITGEGREVRPDLCTASGKGISSGEVGEAVSFKVNVPDEAGPGTLGISVSGPHPPKPIDIINNQDGTMDVTYHPIAPGDYTIDVQWGNQHISGSPFTATVTGSAVRNAKCVDATGDCLDAAEMVCNQLGTITVRPGDGAGAGPLRAKLEGPTKAELQLTNNGDGTLLVSFIPKDAGDYKLHLLWGDGDDEDSEINGSPFCIKVSSK